METFVIPACSSMKGQLICDNVELFADEHNLAATS